MDRSCGEEAKPCFISQIPFSLTLPAAAGETAISVSALIFHVLLACHAGSMGMGVLRRLSLV